MKFKKALFVLSAVMLLLTGCNKSAQEEEVLQAYKTHIQLDKVHSSATNVAVQYANYMRNGYYDAAYDLVYVGDGVYYTKDDMQQVDEISKISNKYILTDVTATKSTCILTYREKIGEAYTKAKKGTESEYLGEVCTTEKKVVVPIVEYNNSFYVDVNSDFMATEQIALKVPADCKVWFGEFLLDNEKRDDNGYYIISEYLATAYKMVRLSSAVEDRQIMLILDEENAPTEADYNVIPIHSTADGYNGLRSFEYAWNITRNTQEDAVVYAKEIIQTMFDDVVNGVDFYDSNTFKQMATSGNSEEVKPEYLKLVTYYTDTVSRTYSDLICVDLKLTDEETMKRKGYTNIMLDYNTMRLHVDLDYSYLTESSLTETTTPRTGNVTGYIYMTKENGTWKLSSIETRMLKNIR